MTNMMICAAFAGYTVYNYLYHMPDFSLNHPPASTCSSFLLLNTVMAALALLCCIMYITYLIYMCVLGSVLYTP